MSMNLALRGRISGRLWFLAIVVLAAIVATVIGCWVGGLKIFYKDLSAQPSAEEMATPSWFVDMTKESGIRLTYCNGEDADHLTLLESLGGGVALLDYDGDGLLDVLVTGGGSFTKKRTDYPAQDDKYALALRQTPPEILGRPCKLYRNLGNWKFQDVTSDAGLDMPWFYTHGLAVADYDRDGWPDFLVTGYGRVMLLHNGPNGKGGRRFADVTEQVGLSDRLWSTSAGWADLDGDGWPDIYVCHYADWSFANHIQCDSQGNVAGKDVCPPQRYKPQVHGLHRNMGGKKFCNVATEQGFRPCGYGLGVVLLDLNGDGRPDIYVANDASNKLLFMNRGGRLEEKGSAAGVALDDAGNYTGSMGVDAGDYDRSGKPALWVTNYQGDLHGLYKNLGRELFHFQTRAAGIAAIGQLWVGFGTGFLDVDNDGWEDLVIANGHVLRHPGQGGKVNQRPLVLHNVQSEGRRFFKDVSSRCGEFFLHAARGRGLAIGDLDNDGWPDLVFSHTNAPVVLLRNDVAKYRPANWLGIQLVGKGHRDMIGSTVIVESPGARQTRFAKGGGSYLSANDSRILFGLGDVTCKQRVTVQWSWGKTQSWELSEPNFYWILTEGEPEPRRVDAVSPHGESKTALGPRAIGAKIR